MSEKMGVADTFAVVRQSDGDAVLETFEAQGWREAREIFRKRIHVYDDECLRRAHTFEKGGNPLLGIVNGRVHIRRVHIWF